MFEEFTVLQEPKLRVFEAFSGIGTQRMALRNLGIPHEVVAIAEIDKFAIKSYEAIHGHTNNLGDISIVDVDDIPDHDLFTYSFPCQDISLAGKRRGFEEGSGTRSSLLWECRRVIESKKPTYLMLENVKNLVGKKYKPGFEKWLEWLEEQGYTNYWEVLNAKDYGIPQNRERVFVISILGDHEPYEFPEKEELTVRLKDVLEDGVDEKFYLSEEKTKELTWDMDEQDKYIKVLTNTSRTGHGSQNVHDVDGISPTLAARDYKGPKQIAEPKVDRIGGVFDKENRTRQAGSIYNKNQLAPTLDTMQGGWRQPSVLVKDTNKKDNKDVVIGASRGRNPENPSDRTVGAPTKQRLEINQNGTSNTITSVQKDNYAVEVPNLRVRKLTPKECWRLMGCSDEDFDKAQEVNSNTQLYKQAGNAIVVDVLEKLFDKLFSYSEFDKGTY